jgi:Nitrile hydratase, alpha chain
MSGGNGNGKPEIIAYGKVMAKVWSDPGFKTRLLAAPHAALAELGIAVPAGKTVRVVEDTESVVHLVLRPPPSGELSTEDLRNVVGGIPAVQFPER